MKKLLILLLALSALYAWPAFALEWHTANQTTIGWDAVTYDGMEVNQRLSYICYLSNAVTDPNKTNPAQIGKVQDPTILVTLTNKGSYIFGVKTVLEEGTEGTWVALAESAIGWSDDPQYAQGGQTFGLRYYPAPNAPTNIRPE